MKYNKLLFAAMVVVFLTACGNKDAKTEQTAQKPTAPVVSVVTAQAEDVDVTNTFTSNVEPFAVNNIVSQTAGRIVSIRAEVGDKVRKGQLLATMDDVNLSKTRMQYVNDSTELVRLTELYNIGAVAQADYDMAKLALNITQKTYYNLAENTYQWCRDRPQLRQGRHVQHDPTHFCRAADPTGEDADQRLGKPVYPSD